MKIKNLLLFVLFLFFSCTNIHKKYVGVWTIESIKSKNKKIELYNLLANGFTLDSNNKCYLPKINPDDNSDCTWIALKEDGEEYLIFKGVNNSFLGKYLVTAHDSNWSTLTLISEYYELECIKIWGVYK